MGIKTLVKDNDQHTVYPCLKETIDGDVFLCNVDYRAVCVALAPLPPINTTARYSIGKALYGVNIPTLYPFNGTVTLSNE